MKSAVVYPFCVALLVAAGPAAADWGGYAVNPGTYDWAYSAGWDSKSAARDRAMFHCRNHAGDGANCKVVLLTANCGGMARGFENFKPRYFVAEAANRDAAAEIALDQCKAALGTSCESRHKFCASDL